MPRSTSEAAIECATEIFSALKGHPEIKLRMGIHSGPGAFGVPDLEKAWRLALQCREPMASIRTNENKLGGFTLTPKNVGGVEKSVDYYRWQKTAAASPQFARNEPK